MSSEAVLDAVVVEELRLLSRELDQDVLGDVVSAYRKVGPELLDQIREAASTRAFDALARAAHTLKGSSAQLGAIVVRDLARELESDARAGREGRVLELAERCRTAFEQASTALAREAGRVA